MRKLLTLLAATLFAAATQLSSLLAQTKQYYATVEAEGQDTILCIRGYSKMPEVKDHVIFVQEKELSDIALLSKNLLNEDQYYYQKSENLTSHIKRVKFDIDANFKPVSTKYWFAYFASLEKVEGIGKLNAANLTSTAYMFRGCYKLPSIDLSWFNTENVTEANWMFYGCSKLEYLDFSVNGLKAKSSADFQNIFGECRALKIIDFGECELQATLVNIFNNCTTLNYAFCGKNSVFSETNFTKDYVFGKDNRNYKKLVGYKSNGDSVVCDGTQRAWINTADNGGLWTDKNSEKIEIAAEKTTYTYGEELDLASATLRKTIVFANGDRSVQMDVCTLEDIAHTVKGFDSKKLGKQTVTVTYGGKEYSFKVEVEVSDPLTAINVAEGPNKTKYTDGEALSVDKLFGGVELELEWESGNTNTLPLGTIFSSLTSGEIEAHSVLTSIEECGLSEEQVMILDQTFSITKTINYLAAVMKLNKPELIETSFIPTVRLNYGVDIQLFNTSLKRTIKRDTIINETGEGVDTTFKESVVIDPADSGKRMFSVKKGDLGFSWEVQVVEDYIYIEASAMPSVSEYKLPFTAEDLNLAGGVIKKVYASGKIEEYAMDALKYEIIEGLEQLKLGKNTLVLKFTLDETTTWEWEFDINIVEGGGSEEGGSGGEEPGEGDEPIVAVEDMAAVCSGAAFEAWANGGVLSVSVERAGVLEVLGVNGVLLRRLALVGGGSLRLPLERGVYVLRMGGEVRKVVVD